MSILRRFLVIILLIFLIVAFKLLQPSDSLNFHAETLIALGFILLAAFSFGELTNLLGIPKIIGYLIAGVIFGPYSDIIFKTKLLGIFSDLAINDLKLLNGLAIGLISLYAGSEINIKDLKIEKRTISFIVLFKVIATLSIITLLLIIISPQVEFLKNISFNNLILLSLLVSLLMIETSPAVTIAVMNETGDRSKLSKLVLNTAVIKDIVIAILLGFLFSISNSILNFQSIGFDSLRFFTILQEVLLSIIFGIILGLIAIGYLKFIKSEKFIFLLAFILIGSRISEYLQLNTFLVFIITGFVLKNYSKFDDELIESIEKLSMLIFVVFFTIVGASLNIKLLVYTYQIALIIFIVRTLIIFLSTRMALRITGKETELKNNLWLGFISQSSIVIGLTIFIISRIPQIGEYLFPIIISVVSLNLLFGPALFKLAIKKYNKAWNRAFTEKDKKIEYEFTEQITPYKKFNVPQFEDKSLNELIISLRENLISHLQEFENILINKRSEEALEFYYQIVEKYIDEYQQLKNIFTSGKISGKEIKEKVLLTQQEISEWFAKVSIQRKSVEQQILNAEFLLQKLFDDLKDYCESAPDFVVVEQEKDKYETEIDDSYLVKFSKSIKRINRKIRKTLGFKSFLKRKIPYVTLVKYYFEYQIALEMEKVAFLLGLERLNVLRKVKKIYDDVTLNLEELTNLIAEHKDVEAVSLLAVDKLNEIHERLKQEISSIGEEIELSNKNISTRLNYAFANPFNQFLKSILKAGTIELNIKKFHFSKIYSESIKAKETTLETIRFWVNYLIGFLGVCERDARTFEITGKINLLINDTMINYSDMINNHIRNLISELDSLFKTFEKEISNKEFLKFENLLKIENLISKYRDEIILVLNEKGISKLTFIKKTQNITNIINSLKDKFNFIIKDYEKEIKVLDEKDFELKETRTKYIELKTLHLPEIIKNYFENEILQELIKLNEIISGHLSSSILELKNIENVIYYHFNIAIDELNKLKTDKIKDRVNEEILKIVDDTLKASTKLLREKLKVWARQVEKFEREVEISLTEKIYSQISNIKESFRKELTEKLEKQIEISKSQFLILKLNHKLKELYLLFKKIYLLISRKTNRYLKPLVREVKEFFAVDLEGKSVVIYLYDQTVYDEKVYNSLPFVYKKLFDYTSSEIVEILVGREKEKKLINQAFERNQKGLSGSTAIIGESGTGKSSLISSFLSKIHTDTNIHRYNFEKTILTEKELLKILSDMLGMNYIATSDEIISELNLEPKYNIIILEDIHKIYLRKFGGLEAMKKLLLIISETSNKIFWIVSISYHAWQLLNRILNIGNYFPFQLKTEVLSKEQIKDAILKRHKTSGYNLEFLTDEEYKVHKKLKYSLLHQDHQIALEEEFFNELYQACEGNITSALFYWMKSIKDFKNDTVYIKPLKKLDFRYLENFDIEMLLTLSNLIQHGSLTIKEHQEIFKCDDEKSKGILNFLNSANLIQFDMNERGEKIYFINPAIYKPVEIELRKLHIFD